MVEDQVAYHEDVYNDVKINFEKVNGLELKNLDAYDIMGWYHKVPFFNHILHHFLLWSNIFQNHE